MTEYNEAPTVEPTLGAKIGAFYHRHSAKIKLTLLAAAVGTTYVLGVRRGEQLALASSSDEDAIDTEVLELEPVDYQS